MSYLPDSTFRACDAPGCTATYDAVTGPLGQTPERCWRLHRTFSLHLCPDHSWLTGAGEGPHMPRLDRESRSASCSCEESLPGITLGQMKEAYRRHIASLPEAVS
jgi:hypothetical protein